MKKLIIALIVTASAAMSQAASINWKVNTESWKLQDGKTFANAGTSMWLVDNTYKSSIISALKNSEVINFSGDWKAAISDLDGVYGTAETSDNTGKLAQTLITNAELVDNEIYEDAYYDLCTLIIDDVTKSDTFYYMISTGTEESWATDNPENYDTAVFGGTNFKEESGATGWQLAQSVPEPTSGLLILLGMAGLALRRRHA